MELGKKIGLWKKKTKTGGDWFAGKTEEISFALFPNTYKTADNQPDFHLIPSAVVRKEDHPEAAMKAEIVKQFMVNNKKTLMPATDETPF